MVSVMIDPAPNHDFELGGVFHRQPTPTHRFLARDRLLTNSSTPPLQPAGEDVLATVLLVSCTAIAGIVRLYLAGRNKLSFQPQFSFGRLNSDMWNFRRNGTSSLLY